MLKTRITELLGITHPVVLAGMYYITEPKLVSAVSNAGGLGILGCAHLPADKMSKYIAEIRKLTDKPFGINQALAAHSAQENVKVAIKERVPIVNYSLGKPWFIDQVHEYGGKVIGTVATAKHALQAARLGADAIIITGHEAGAHGAAATSLILIPLVASQVKVPLIAAGGFSDGRGLAAAMVLGADAISMGTRFMLTKECVLHEHFKQLCTQATEQDTLYSDVFEGIPGRVLKTELSMKMLNERNRFLPMTSLLEMGLPFGDFVRTGFRMFKAEERTAVIRQARLRSAVPRLEKAIDTGDERIGVLPTGQVCGAIRDIPTCKELVERIVNEAEAALEGAGRKRNSGKSA